MNYSNKFEAILRAARLPFIIDDVDGCYIVEISGVEFRVPFGQEAQFLDDMGNVIISRLQKNLN